MLSRSIRSVLKTPTPLHRTSRVAAYHQSSTLLNKKATQLQESDWGPFDKLAQGFNVVKATILNAPPLQKITKPTIETLPFTGRATSWEQAVKEAQSLVSSADQERMFDPVKLVGKDVWELKDNITKLVGSGHPLIRTIGKNYLQSDTNRIRPLLVLLIAKATCQAEKKSAHQLLFDSDNGDALVKSTTSEDPIIPTQRRLAEISEMVYTATLLHYDVLDTEQQHISNPGLGNKMAVLAGDFLLARSSLALAHLKNAECIELIATCIADLAEGGFMKLRYPLENNQVFDDYVEKIYLKTGSLIAQSCKASAVLAGCSSDVTNTAFTFGKHFGIASQVSHPRNGRKRGFVSLISISSLQLISDVRGFSATAANMNKKQPSAWINAPVLLAWEEIPEFGPLIKREFSTDGDVDQVLGITREK